MRGPHLNNPAGPIILPSVFRRRNRFIWMKWRFFRLSLSGLRDVFERIIHRVPQLIHAKWLMQHTDAADADEFGRLIGMDDAGAKENRRVGSSAAYAIEVRAPVFLGNHPVKDDQVHGLLVQAA